MILAGSTRYRRLMGGVVGEHWGGRPSCSTPHSPSQQLPTKGHPSSSRWKGTHLTHPCRWLLSQAGRVGGSSRQPMRSPAKGGNPPCRCSQGLIWHIPAGGPPCMPPPGAYWWASPALTAGAGGASGAGGLAMPSSTRCSPGWAPVMEASRDACRGCAWSSCQPRTSPCRAPHRVNYNPLLRGSCSGGGVVGTRGRWKAWSTGTGWGRLL